MTSLIRRLLPGSVLAAIVFALAAAVGTPSSVAAPTGRVIGGAPVAGASYGSAVVALVMADSKSPYGGEICGGVLVAPTLVLTARSCVESAPFLGMPRRYDVTLGTGSGFELGNAWPGKPRAAVVSIHRTPGLQHAAFEGGRDLALLRIGEVLPGSTTLPIAHAGDEAWWGGTAGRASGAQVVGWGAQVDGTATNYPSSYPHMLMSAAVPIVQSRACVRGATAAREARYLCAGAPKRPATTARTPCAGDAGGPLLATDPAGSGSVRVIGVTSHRPLGERCASAPWSFVRIADQASWIDEFIAAPNAVPSGSTPPTVKYELSRVDGRYGRIAALQVSNVLPTAQGVVVLADTADGYTYEVARVTNLPKANVQMPPTWSGRIHVRYRTIDGAGNETVSSPMRILRTTVDRHPPRIARARAKPLGGGRWDLSWTPPVEDDRVVGVAIQRRRPGATKWLEEAWISCDECWAARAGRITTHSAHWALPGKWQFRFSPQDRAGNWGRWVVATS